MLTLSELRELQADALADDVEIFDEMCSWTKEQVVAYFESGGSEKPSAMTPPTVYADMKLTAAGKARFAADKAPPRVFVASDGARIVYQYSHGPKTPILICGGGTSGRTEACKEYGAESDQLKEHAILIFDRRGAGSGASDVRYTTAGPAVPEVMLQARDVAELIGHLQLPPVILYGWSSGARLFGTTALASPALVRALVLCILTGGPKAASLLGEQYYLRYAAAADKGGMERVLLKDGFASRAAVNGQVAPYLQSLDPHVFASTMRASAQLFADTTDEPALGLRASDLAACRLPALVVYNAGSPDDGMHMESVTRAVAQALPESEPPVVSTNLREWYGAILRFFEKHA